MRKWDRNIPPELRERKQWVGVAITDRDDGKKDKRRRGVNHESAYTVS